MSEHENERMAHPSQPYAEHGHVGVTIREHAAITLGVPDSGIPELDEMIRRKVRRELAGQALVGLLVSPEHEGTIPEFAADACSYADALLSTLTPTDDAGAGE